jgi:cytochrome c556
VFALAGIAAFATLALSAEDLAKAVKERRYLMKDVVCVNTKLGGDMIKGTVPYDAAKLAKAMNGISGVPDQYVKLFPKGSKQGAVPDSEALPKVWEDFEGFKAEGAEAQGRVSRGGQGGGARQGRLHGSVQRHDQGVQGVPRDLSREGEGIIGEAGRASVAAI